MPYGIAISLPWGISGYRIRVGRFVARVIVAVLVA